jgi:hypothetical protein
LTSRSLVDVHPRARQTESSLFESIAFGKHESMVAIEEIDPALGSQVAALPPQ